MTILVIEGCDYAGKTTTAKQLLAHLTGDVVLLHEPGGTPVAETVLSAMREYPVDTYARQLFMQACRLDMINQYDVSAASDTLFILDRYVPSTIVYGTVDGVPVSSLLSLFDAFPTPTPDLTVVLSPSWDVIEDRIYGARLDNLEGSRSRLKLVHYAYQKFANLFPGDVVYTPNVRVVAMYDILACMYTHPRLKPYVVTDTPLTQILS